MLGIWGLSSKWKGFWVFQVWFQPVSTLKKNSSSFFPRKLSHQRCKTRVASKNFELQQQQKKYASKAWFKYSLIPKNHYAARAQAKMAAKMHSRIIGCKCNLGWEFFRKSFVLAKQKYQVRNKKVTFFPPIFSSVIQRLFMKLIRLVTIIIVVQFAWTKNGLIKITKLPLVPSQIPNKPTNTYKYYQKVTRISICEPPSISRFARNRTKNRK